MPQLSSLVLKDRESTPVDHTFTPESIDAKGVARVVESNGVPVGNNAVTLSLRRTSTNRYVAEVRGTFPVVQNPVVNGVTTSVVARTAYAVMTFTFDSTSTTQERDNVVGMMASALEKSKTLVDDMIVDLQGIY